MRKRIILLLLSISTILFEFSFAETYTLDRIVFRGKIYSIEGYPIPTELDESVENNIALGVGNIGDGILPVNAGNELIYIDLTTMKEIYSLDSGYGTAFCNGVAACSNGSVTYIIDTRGNEVACYNDSDIVDNLFVNELPFILINCLTQEYYIVDPINNTSIKLDRDYKIEEMFAFHEGYARFIDMEKNYGLINTSGDIIYRNDVQFLSDVTNGCVCILKWDGTQCCIDLQQNSINQINAIVNDKNELN